MVLESILPSYSSQALMLEVLLSNEQSAGPAGEQSRGPALLSLRAEPPRAL